MAIFIGGIGPVFGAEGPLQWLIGGLVGVLVLAAGIVLAFTGRYPAPIYDVAVGMDRWALRVAAYAALMTDAYPPFRLDIGGSDPGDELAGPLVPPAPVPSSVPVGWTGPRVVAVVAGAVLTLSGAGLLAAGGAALWADRTARTDGMLTTSTWHHDTPARALITEHVGLPDLDLNWFGPDSLLGSVRVDLAAGDGSQRFVGIARTADVEAYLDGVAYATIQDLTSDQDAELSPGDRVPADPDQVGIWVASTSGPTPRELTWDSSGGDWTIVIMRPDGSAGFDATVRAGAEIPVLPWIAGGALGVGGLVSVAGIVLLVLPVTRASRGASPTARSGVPEPMSVG